MHRDDNLYETGGGKYGGMLLWYADSLLISR